METYYVLTTVDNPYDPINDFDNWYAFDLQKNYNSCSLLDRFSLANENLTFAENVRANNQAIDDIIRCDVTNKFTKLCYDSQTNKRVE